VTDGASTCCYPLLYRPEDPGGTVPNAVERRAPASPVVECDEDEGKDQQEGQ